MINFKKFIENVEEGKQLYADMINHLKKGDDHVLKIYVDWLYENGGEDRADFLRGNNLKMHHVDMMHYPKTKIIYHDVAPWKMIGKTLGKFKWTDPGVWLVSGKEVGENKPAIAAFAVIDESQIYEQIQIYMANGEVLPRWVAEILADLSSNPRNLVYVTNNQVLTTW